MSYVVRIPVHIISVHGLDDTIASSLARLW